MNKKVFYGFYIIPLSGLILIILLALKSNYSTHNAINDVLYELKNQNISSDLIISQIEKIDGKIGTLMQTDTITFLITIVSVIVLSLGLFILQRYNAKYIQISNVFSDYNKKLENQSITIEENEKRIIVFSKLLIAYNQSVYIKRSKSASNIPSIREILTEINDNFPKLIPEKMKNDFVDYMGYLKNNLNYYIETDVKLEKIINDINGKISKN